MKLRTRLTLTLAAVAVLVAGPAFYALNRLAEVRDIASEQRSRFAYAFLQLGQLQTSLAELDRYERGYIIAGEDEQRVAMEKALLISRAEADTLVQLGYREAHNTVRVLQDLDQATSHIISLVESRRTQEATAYFERVKPLLSSAQQSLEALATAIDARSLEGIDAAHRISSSAVTTTLVALVACLLVAIALAIWNAAAVTTPILQLRRAMARVADGHFEVPADLPIRRGDEISDLSRSFSWMTQQLQRLDRMKAEFISIATHELKTPINVINGYAELLQEGVYGKTPAKQREALETIQEQTRVLTNLVNQLLDISRLEAGGLQLEMKDVVLRELFARVERSFVVLARRKNIDFRIEVENSVPVAIKADSDRLSDQVLGNLLSNALKFTPEGGTIRVRVWVHQDRLQIEVRDSGVGVPPEQLPYIFDKYFQVGQEARSKGAGLGLAIARETVEAHGGWITVESQPGQGTAFLIALPIRKAADKASVVEKTA